MLKLANKVNVLAGLQPVLLYPDVVAEVPLLVDYHDPHLRELRELLDPSAPHQPLSTATHHQECPQVQE